jgi:hypothetical protein
MLARLHFKGVSISNSFSNQQTLTPFQQAFISIALVELTNEERKFQILIHGGKPTEDESPGSVRDNAKRRKVDPRTVTRKT